ncbi:MAG: hypothetical protein ABJD97_00635 [Betaproteobacteria bacterium]
MTDKYNEALGEQLKKNVWDRTAEAAANMSALDKADLITSVTGIFDPTPVSDGAGMAIALVQGDPLGIALSAVSLVPYLGDAVAKPFKIARKAPKVAAAIEAMFKGADNLAGAGKAALKDAGLSLEQVAAARKKALESVQQAMLDAKNRIANCETCKLKNAKGEGKQLQMPQNGPNGNWAGGVQPPDGNGVFKFNEPKTLPDGRQVSEIEFKNGAPDFDKYVEGGKHDLWQVSGNAKKDGTALQDMMRETDPKWQPPDPEDFTLHHFEDGTVGYVPKAIHDKRMEGVAHTGGASMTDNQLF